MNRHAFAHIDTNCDVLILYMCGGDDEGDDGGVDGDDEGDEVC